MASQNSIFGQYIPGKSPIHRLHAGTKLLTFAAASVFLSVTGNMVFLGGLAILFFACALVAAIPRAMILGFIRKTAILCLLTFLLSAFFTPGHAILRIPLIPVSVTSEGIRAGFVFSLRTFLLMGFVSLLLWSTSPVELLGIFQTGRRDRAGATLRSFCFMLVLALTFVPVMIEEARRMSLAQRARCGLEAGGPVERIKDVSRITIPLISGVIRKSELLARSLQIKGYEA